MSKISSVGSSGVSRSSEVSSGGRGGINSGGVTINEKFNFPEIDLPDRGIQYLRPEERPYRDLLFDLFLEIISSGVDIVPTRPRDHGGYVVEASFSPAKSNRLHHKIMAPLRGVQDVLVAPYHNIVTKSTRFILSEFVDSIVDHSTDADILRLLVVIGHEFGHYISFLRGFHDQALQIGLNLMSAKQVGADSAKFTWLVFREESTAWLCAKQVLERMRFIDWKVFDAVKNSSLSTYWSTLQLEDASLEIYYKLSLLGDDFLNNCKSNLFNNESSK